MQYLKWNSVSVFSVTETYVCVQRWLYLLRGYTLSWHFPVVTMHKQLQAIRINNYSWQLPVSVIVVIFQEMFCQLAFHCHGYQQPAFAYLFSEWSESCIHFKEHTSLLTSYGHQNTHAEPNACSVSETYLDHFSSLCIQFFIRVFVFIYTEVHICSARMFLFKHPIRM